MKVGIIENKFVNWVLENNVTVPLILLAALTRDFTIPDEVIQRHVWLKYSPKYSPTDLASVSIHDDGKNKIRLEPHFINRPKGGKIGVTFDITKISKQDRMSIAVIFEKYLNASDYTLPNDRYIRELLSLAFTIRFSLIRLVTSEFIVMVPNEKVGYIDLEELFVPRGHSVKGIVEKFENYGAENSCLEDLLSPTTQPYGTIEQKVDTPVLNSFYDYKQYNLGSRVNLVFDSIVELYGYSTKATNPHFIVSQVNVTVAINILTNEGLRIIYTTPNYISGNSLYTVYLSMLNETVLCTFMLGNEIAYILEGRKNTRLEPKPRSCSMVG